MTEVILFFFSKILVNLHGAEANPELYSPTITDFRERHDPIIVIFGPIQPPFFPEIEISLGGINIKFEIDIT
jgi:hypothetical protein